MSSGVAIGGPATGATERSIKTTEDEPLRGHQPPIAFGPVRSRRLGWSLGINNVPPQDVFVRVHLLPDRRDDARSRQARGLP